MIRFEKAAAVNGQILDLLVRATGGNYQGKGDRNGKNKLFGVINMWADRSVTLEFSLVDSGSGKTVTVDSFAISFFDLDEGKKGKARTTITSCASNAIFTTNAELAVERPDGCYAVSSTQHGTSKNNPTSPADLTPSQAGRSVTFVYAGGVSSATVTLAIAKGHGARNTFFALEPTLACLDGYDPSLPLKLPAPGEEDAASALIPEVAPEVAVDPSENLQG